MLLKISCALSLGHARSGLVGQRIEEALDDPESPVPRTRSRSRACKSSRVSDCLQLPPKTLTPSQNASKSVQIADRSASQQNMYEEDDLRLPPSTGSIIVATAVGPRLLGFRELRTPENCSCIHA